jgi:hypothetical protein
MDWITEGSEFESLQGQEFSILQTGSEVHPASYPKDNGGSFLVDKAAGA